VAHRRETFMTCKSPTIMKIAFVVDLVLFF
jgi:hypothetical protein